MAVLGSAVVKNDIDATKLRSLQHCPRKPLSRSGLFSEGYLGRKRNECAKVQAMSTLYLPNYRENCYES